MQQTSALYQRLSGLTHHWYEKKVVVNGVEYGENQIFSLSTNISMFEHNPEVGKAVAAEIDLQMLVPTAEVPRMATVIPYIRACGSVEGQQQKSEWIQKGVYYIDTREETKNSNGLDLLTIHGFDAMMFSEQDFSESTREWPEEGVLDTDIVSDIASTMGVSIDDRTWQIMTDENRLPLPAGYTLRELLGFIASMYVGSFVMTDLGKLRLVSLTELPPETNLLIDNDGIPFSFGGDRIIV